MILIKPGTLFEVADYDDGLKLERVLVFACGEAGGGDFLYYITKLSFLISQKANLRL